MTQEAGQSAVREARDAVLHALRPVIVGHDDVIDGLLTALACGGHALVCAPPGQGKTAIATAFARATGLEFRRIQFTADLMPSDLIGTEVYVEDKPGGHRQRQFVRGPLFSQFVLADEINRSWPRTQSALLEALESGRVSVGRETHVLDQHFCVVATRSVPEQDRDGTYPLPLAQLDRFLVELHLSWPTPEEEAEVLRRRFAASRPEASVALSPAAILELRGAVRSVAVTEPAVQRAVSLVQATRPESRGARVTREWILSGASSRAATDLLRAAQFHAAAAGRCVLESADVDHVCLMVLRHRLQLNFTAQAEGVGVPDVIKRLVAEVR
ncbi:MAG TPA: MoxR family ATPase [Gemmataceae bacterium]|nr:MoxR family ATPase [Gemmataceae bacterium]